MARIHHVAVSRRAERRNWTFGAPPKSDKMLDYHRAVLCNFNDYYRRSLWQWAAPQAAMGGGVELADGTPLDPPGEDETAPEAPEWPISHCPRPCSKGFKATSAENAGEPLALPTSQTPAR